jgi:hypothetical protein
MFIHDRFLEKPSRDTGIWGMQRRDGSGHGYRLSLADPLANWMPSMP